MKEKQLEISGELSIIEDMYNDGELLVISNSDFKLDEEWITDTICIFYMCLNRDLFSTYKIVSKGFGVMRNNSHCRITGIGRVRIKMLDGIVKTLDAVRHLPDLKRNFISLNTLYSKGYKYTYASRVLEVNKDIRVVLNNHKRSQLMPCLVLQNL